MPNTKEKAKPILSENDHIRDREVEREDAEEVQQHDLNQGLNTGTHESTRHGVNWPASYRKRTSGGETRKVGNTDSKQRSAGPKTAKKTR